MKWYHGIAEIADSFSFAYPPSWEFGAANVFCGSAVLFLALLFLTNGKIPLRKRISLTMLALFLFVSFEWNLLDFIWHGLHFPNQLPGRQSFLFVFVILLMGYEAIISRNGLTLRGMLFSLGISVGFFFLGWQKSENTMGRWVSVLMIAAVFVFLLVASRNTDKKGLKRLAEGALAFVLLADVCVNGVFVLCQYSRLSDGFQYAKEEELLDDYTEKYESGTTDFYRTEIVPNFTFNPGQLYGVKGISYYSSTMNGNIYHLMENLGNRVYAKNVSTVYLPTPFQDMMFGVRYYYMKGAKTLSYGKLLEKNGNLSVYQSPYALPVAYAVDSDIMDIENTSMTGIALQEKFIRLASGSKRLLAVEAGKTNLRISNAKVSGEYMYAIDPENTVTYTVDFMANGEGHFFVESDFTVGNYEIYLEDVKIRSGSCGADPLIDVGKLSTGDTVTVKVTAKGYSYMLCGLRGYTMEKETLKSVYQKLEKQGLQVEYASDTKITGVISVKEDGVLYASIPAENGWEVYIDGEKQQTYDLGMGLLFCDIEAGEHTVEYRYHAPGLKLGLSLSAAAAVVLITAGVLDFRKKQKIR